MAFSDLVSRIPNLWPLLTKCTRRSFDTTHSYSSKLETKMSRSTLTLRPFLSVSHSLRRGIGRGGVDRISEQRAPLQRVPVGAGASPAKLSTAPFVSHHFLAVPSDFSHHPTTQIRHRDTTEPASRSVRIASRVAVGE